MSNVHPLVSQALPVAAKAAAVQQELLAGSIGRGDVVMATLLSLITKRSAFFYGPPGVSKTATVKALARRIAGAVFYDALMTTVATVQDFIVGRTSIEEEPTPTGGKRIRVKDELGRAAAAHIVFADEMFKAETRVLNVALDLANGDPVRHDGQEFATPLMAFLSASNELPDLEDNLGAIWARMQIRVKVDSLDSAGKEALVWSRLQRYRDEPTAPPTTLTLEEVKILRKARPFVELPREILTIVLDLLKTLQREEGFDFAWLWNDDRRFGRVFDVLQAAALLAGRATVTKADLWVCEWLMWNQPEEIPVVKAKLAPLCRTPLLDAQELVNILLAPGGKMATALSGDRKVAVKAVQEAQTAQEELQKLRQAADSADHPAIDTLLKTVNEALAKALAITLGTAPVS